MDIQNFIAEFKKTFIYDMLCESLEDEQLFEHTIVGNQVIWMKEQTRQMWSMWQAAKANAVPEWISVEDKKPEGACLVKLKERTLHNIMHTALFESEFQVIGGHFAWDMPKVTHWMPLPQEPSHDQ